MATETLVVCNKTRTVSFTGRDGFVFGEDYNPISVAGIPGADPASLRLFIYDSTGLLLCGASLSTADLGVYSGRFIVSSQALIDLFAANKTDSRLMLCIKDNTTVYVRQPAEILYAPVAGTLPAPVVPDPYLETVEQHNRTDNELAHLNLVAVSQLSGITLLDPDTGAFTLMEAYTKINEILTALQTQRS